MTPSQPTSTETRSLLPSHRLRGLSSPATGRPRRRRRFTAALAGVAALAVPLGALAGADPAAASTSYSVTATIDVGNSPDGVAVDPSTGTVYVANSADGAVSVVDGATNAITATIGVGSSPDAIGVDPDTGTVYVANSGDGTVSVIDGASDTVTGTVTVGPDPDGVAVDPATGTVYVANAQGPSVSVIDEATSAVTATISVGLLPFGVTVDPATDTVYTANAGSGTVSVIDGSTNTVTGTITVGGEPYAVAADPATGTVYAADLSSTTVSVIDEATGTVTATISAGDGPDGLAVDPSTDTIYVADDNSGDASVIDGATGNVTSISLGTGTQSAAVNTSTHAAYLTSFAGTVPVITPQATQVISFTAPATGIAGRSDPLTATGGGSGNPVVFSVDSSSGAGVCNVSGTNGSTVNYTAAGSCVIDANQAGDGGYSAAPQVTQTITVNQAPVFVTDSPPATAIAGQPYGYGFTASGTPAPAYALAAGGPSWLSVNASTGVVSGTPPSGTTSFSYQVTATNTAGTATAGPYHVTVTAAGKTADLAATLACPAHLKTGSTGTCALTVANHGPDAAAQVTASVSLPSRLAGVSCSSGCHRSGNVVTWTRSSLNDGKTAKFTVTVKAVTAGQAQVSAHASSVTTDPDPGNNAATAVITIKA